ncbi:hypothetical protein JHK87_004024 [Glycine soja]|nr:hypothetical protein JHK87_004024 [Glycine soja]
MVGVLESIKFEFLGYAPLAPAAVGKLESPSWATEPFPKSVPPVLPPTRLPHNLFPDSVPLTLIESPSSLAKQGARNEELKRADAVVLTYACDEPVSFERVKVPVIVVGCKLDLRDENQLVSLESLTTHIMKHFIEVVTCVECSAATLYQVRCFSAPLQPSEIAEVKTIVEQKVPEGVNSIGLTFPGFIYVHNMFLKKGRTETLWAVLRKFGYDNDLKLWDDFLPVPSKQASDQLEEVRVLDQPFNCYIVLLSLELTGEAVEFLNGIFRLLDTDKDRSLRPAEVDKLFDTAPERYESSTLVTMEALVQLTCMKESNVGLIGSLAIHVRIGGSSFLLTFSYGIWQALLEEIPWNDAPYKDAAEKTDMGYISLNGFLSQTLLEPQRSLANLIYIGYNGNPTAALRVTHRRSVDHKKQTTEKNVFQCYVFGSKHAGKSALLYSLPGKVTRKILILHETPEDGLLQFLSNQDCLAACDVAVFCGTYESSWKKSRDLLEKVVRQGELTGYRTPCLLIAAKDDLAPFPRTILDSVKVTQALGIKAGIHVSMKLVGAAMAVAGLTACRVRAVKKNTTA